jgi:hypothetical protein
MATTTNYGWTTPDNTDLVKDGASAIRTLGSSIDTTLKAQIDAQIPDAVLTTTGDVIYASGASTPARLGIGSTGQYLSVSGGVPAWATSLVSKNSIINGGMDIWQRGTSVAIAASSSGYTTDRWFYAVGANQASTISRQATGDTTNLPTIQYCARVQRNSGQTGGGGVGFDCSIESVNSIPFAGQTITFSFYARRGANYSASSNILNAQVLSGTGTDQNVQAGFTGSATVISQNATLTTTWQRFTYTGTVAASATQLGIRFITTWAGTAGAADFFEVTGVQLELGSIATPFQRTGNTIQAELAACQRYLPAFNSNSTSSTIASGYFPNTTNFRGVYTFQVQPRTAPTGITISSTSHFGATDGAAGFTGTNLTFVAGNSQTVLIDCAISGATTGRGGILYTTSASGQILFTGCEL